MPFPKALMGPLAVLLVAAAAPGANEKAAIHAARSEVAEMTRLAASPQEKRLANETGRLVERIAALVERRASERYVITQARHRADRAAEQRYVQQHNETNLEFLKLQQQIQQQSRRYTTISNVMKVRHDTVKNSINNIR